MLFFINLQPTHLKFDICSVNVALRCILRSSICNKHAYAPVLLLDELTPLLPDNDVLTMDSSQDKLVGADL